MSIQLAPALALALLPVCLDPGPREGPGDELRFAPEQGLRLTKTLRRSSEESLDSSVAYFNDEEQDAETDSSSSSEGLIVLTDEYGASEDGRLLRLARSFDEVEYENLHSSEFGGEVHDFEVTGTSELTGSTIVFEWDEDDEEYSVRDEDEELDDELLEDLRIELDFAELLPDGGEVSEGDEWTIEAEVFAQLMTPEDGIPIDWNSDGWDDDEGDVVIEESDEGDMEESESHEGEVSAEYRGTREVDGVLVGVIALEGELTTDYASERDLDSNHATGSFSYEMTRTRFVEGECLWNLEGGHLHSLFIELDTESVSAQESTFDFDGQEFSHAVESEESGAVTFEVTFEEAE